MTWATRLALLGLLVGAPAHADPAAPCQTVRLADVGWTDVTATTAVLAEVLHDLGYDTRIDVLSVPVTFAALRNGDIDVFLGHWMPSQRAMIAPYLADGSIDVIRTNLEGARYTLAVPTYLHDAGLRDFRDIARFHDELGGVIHGIEPGNDANETLLAMIRNDTLGLGRFRLVESSEQAMLAAVERASAARRPIVFLGWAPHPMNTRLAMRYLSGGDAWFGPGFGGATVLTVTRRGYAAACAEVGRLLANVSFTVEDENTWMTAILHGRQAPRDVARAWIAAHPERIAVWTRGVASTAASGDARSTRGSPHPSAFEALVRRHKLPIGEFATTAVDVARQRGGGTFAAITWSIGGVVSVVHGALAVVPAPLLIVLIGALAWWRRRTLRLPAFVVAALLLIVNLGFWAATIETLALVIVAALAATALGVPVGIVAARHEGVSAVLRPILDLMQTLPTFVYLTPTLVLFGLGVVPGLVSTVVFALPGPIRFTQIGITSVPRPLVEAAQAFGATRWQQFRMVELPAAMPAILAGVTQGIMLSLSMVVIAALVGAGGLGAPVVRALNTVQVGTGIEAGLAIVLLAIILDRLARPAERREVR